MYTVAIPRERSRCRHASMNVHSDWIEHHLKVFGCRAVEKNAPVVLYRATEANLALAREALGRGVAVVAVLPEVGFAGGFDVVVDEGTTCAPKVLKADMAGSKPWKRLRTLHPYMRFKSVVGTSVVSDDDGMPVWLHRKMSASASIIFVGTDLASDLIRYRQGDPAAANNRPTDAVWGFAGERPNYLFEGQLAGESLRERPADWWCEALADALARLCGVNRLPMLPNGAAGAIIVTGDDDQAALSCYAQQREALGSTPITYYLHPLTKHTASTLKQLGSGRRLELGLHPDALERPNRYADLFAEQAKWFEQLTGESARTVRNHGFLNDGYWGHATAWNAHGVMGSSNLPGLDGCIINGSLLPSRLLLDDKLTEHWSILTAIGDGVVFVHGWDDRQSANCILDLADRIRNDGVPGVIVVNLHPENIDKTRGMHQAVRKVVEDGFVPWTMSECFEWFARPRQPEVQQRKQPSFLWWRRQ
ncbi:hypothetical protein [Bradyrhizobium sp. USDA 3364]